MDVPAKFGDSPEILIARSIGLQRTRRSYAKLHRLRSWVVSDYAKVVANGAQTHEDCRRRCAVIFIAAGIDAGFGSAGEMNLLATLSRKQRRQCCFILSSIASALFDEGDWLDEPNQTEQRDRLFIRDLRAHDASFLPNFSASSSAISAFRSQFAISTR